MKFTQEEDIQYLLVQQQRYKKLIKSYQVNDLSNAYNQLKQTNEKLDNTIKQQALEIKDLRKQVDDSELKFKKLKTENEKLRKTVHASETSNNTNIHQQLHDIIIEELHRHLLLIYHLSHVSMTLEQFFSSKEVFDDMDNQTTGKFPALQGPSNDPIEGKEISQRHLLTALQQHVKEAKDEEHAKQKIDEIKSDQSPKKFYFKDLQSYQSAYILPEKKQKEETSNPNSIFQQNTKSIQKIKKNQLQKASSLGSESIESVEQEDPSIKEEEIPLPESFTSTPIVPEESETATQEIVEETVDDNTQEAIPETKTFLQQLWHKIKRSD